MPNLYDKRANFWGRCGLLWALLLSVGFEVQAQSGSAAATEAAFTRLDSMLTRRQVERGELSKQANALAREVNELKANDNLSYFQGQRLNRLLQESQGVANRIEAMDQDIRSLNERYAQVGRTLLAAYDRELSGLLKQMENSRPGQENKKSLAVQVEALRARQAALQERLSLNKATEVKLTPVEIEADDTPKQIERKADLLKDQEAKMRRLAQQLKKQTEDAQKELAVKNRMSDLVTDLALFDQQEEVLGNLNPQQTSVRAANDESLSDSQSGHVFPGQLDGLGQIIFVGAKDFDIANLSPEQLEVAIETLRKQEKRIQVQADSLGLQAERFYRTVSEMKKR